MGTEEGLKWLAEQYDKQDKIDHEFLLKHGWTHSLDSNGDGRYAKGEHSDLYSFKAAEIQLWDLIKPEWRIIDVNVALGEKGELKPGICYFQSSKTGKIYQYLEIIDIYYGTNTEETLWESCSAKTKELNALYPDEKPDVMNLRFTSEKGYQKFEEGQANEK